MANGTNKGSGGQLSYQSIEAKSNGDHCEPDDGQSSGIVVVNYGVLS